MTVRVPLIPNDSNAKPYGYAEIPDFEPEFALWRGKVFKFFIEYSGGPMYVEQDDVFRIPDDGVSESPV